MGRHWHLFGASLVLWTTSLALMITATATDRMVFAAWSLVTALVGTCATCWVVARHERGKIEEFCSGSADEIIQWFRRHEAERDCAPMR